MMDEQRIRRHIVCRLVEKRAYVRGHLLGERLVHGLPSHLRGTGKFVLAQLVKEEIVLVYGPTKHGVAYQLNIEKLDEIERLLQE
jgi:hypothetical protein